MDAYVAQWVGKRPKQEDAYGVRHFSEGSLAVVCDGMGGHSLGDMASAAAVEAFIESFTALTEAPGAPSLTQRMRAALEAANTAVGRLYEGTDSCGGTTLLAAFVSHGVLRWVSVGDSALYLWRHDTLKRLNDDHSMRSVFERLISPGAFSRREALARGHMLRSAVMGGEIPLVDEHERPFPLLPGDRLILSTDGLESLVEESVMSVHLRSMLNRRGGSLAALLVDACRELGDEYADNVTVITMDV